MAQLKNDPKNANKPEMVIEKINDLFNNIKVFPVPGAPVRITFLFAKRVSFISFDESNIKSYI